MAGGSRNNDDDDGNVAKPDPDEAALSARLGHLNQRLSKIQGDRKIQTDQAEAGGANATSRASAMAVGLRLSSELVAGVVVGTILGWGFDRLLSTSPWGLIVLMLLGFVAGVINVMRSAGVGRT
ncbi:AtpZ/AtpI family protein [soil metagenome]